MAVTTVRIDPQLTILLGGGGNSIILTSQDNKQALVVDTKMGQAAKQERALVSAPEITLVSTHFHGDHVGGNNLYPNAKIIAGAYTPGQWAAAAGKISRYPDVTVPAGKEIVLPIGTELVHIRNTGAAHTFNDVVVYLQNRKLLVTGDIVFLKRHPVLFAKSGCNVPSWIHTLDTLQKMYDITTLVPGHGALSDASALANMENYFVSIRQAIGNDKKLAECKDALKDYSGIPGMASFEKSAAFIKAEKAAQK
jgi:cyclase